VTFKAHGATVEGLAYSPDGKALASGGWDDVGRLWDVAAMAKPAR
jgi:WD40 repeat protein